MEQERVNRKKYDGAGMMWGRMGRSVGDEGKRVTKEEEGEDENEEMRNEKAKKKTTESMKEREEWSAMNGERTGKQGMGRNGKRRNRMEEREWKQGRE